MSVENEFLGNIDRVMQCLVTKDAQNILYELYAKISWNVRDFDHIFATVNKSRQDVIFMIVLCDWILEAHHVIFECYKRYAAGFLYSHDTEWRTMRDKFRALRAFVVAHPLNTDKHPDEGYDGSKHATDIYPCNGIRPNVIALARHVDDSDGDDFFISWYDSKAVVLHFEGHSYQFLHDFSHMTINRVRELMDYLSKLRKKDLYKF